MRWRDDTDTTWRGGGHDCLGQRNCLRTNNLHVLAHLPSLHAPLHVLVVVRAAKVVLPPSVRAGIVVVVVAVVVAVIVVVEVVLVVHHSSCRLRTSSRVVRVESLRRGVLPQHVASTTRAVLQRHGYLLLIPGKDRALVNAWHDGGDGADGCADAANALDTYSESSYSSSSCSCSYSTATDGGTVVVVSESEPLAQRVVHDVALREVVHHRRCGRRCI